MCTIDGCGSKTTLAPIPLAQADRRAFLAGTMSLPLATVLAFPELARAQAARLTDISIPTPNGGAATGVIALPKNLPAPAVLLVHEWWGLNDQIKSVAAELAEQGYIALAIDLYDGKVTRDGATARKLMNGLNGKRATEQLATAVNHLRDMKGSTGKTGTVGWCFGGGWSLNASIAAPVDATVVYYGRVTQSAKKLARLQGPVMGHFADKDGWVNPDMVAGLERQMAKAGKADDLSVFWYTAHHGFANPTSARYDEADTAQAWQRTLAFFADNLRS